MPKEVLLENVVMDGKIILNRMLKGVGCETILVIRLNIGIIAGGTQFEFQPGHK
jgi:hypothetical protein